MLEHLGAPLSEHDQPAGSVDLHTQTDEIACDEPSAICEGVACPEVSGLRGQGRRREELERV